MNTHAKKKWKPAAGRLTTRWTEKVNPNNVHPAYPRPQMVRNEWLNLNGLWNYAIRKIDEPTGNYDGKILVPFPIESSLSGVKKPLYPDEVLLYQRTFFLPEKWDDNNLLLHFGAVEWKVEVWINQHKVGEHTGGYYSFHFEISHLVQAGENEIKIRVWDPTDTYGQERGKQTLKPKGIFYTAVSGIWQTVWLEPIPENYIASIKITPHIDQAELALQVVTNKKHNDLQIKAVILNEGEVEATGNGTAEEVWNIPIPNQKLWIPESPFLYDLEISLYKDNVQVDTVRSYFGMRKFSIERDKDGKKKLFVNNKPFFQQGILDQGYWPDGLYTAPTDEALEYDILCAKKLGFNVIRKHIKVEPARWYYHCDRLGMIVWQDMINGGSGWKNLYHLILPNVVRGYRVNDTTHRIYKVLGREKEDNRNNFKKELKEMIDMLYNVPSIAMWIPFNEAWGQFDAAEIGDWVSEYDPSRYVMHTSGWYDQGGGEIRSTHIYFRKLKMPNYIKDRAVIISEYGGYSLLKKGHVWRENKGFGYRSYKTEEDLFRAYESLVKDQLKPLINKGVAAAVYTQLTDVEGETNGLVTYDREVIKLATEEIHLLHHRLSDTSEQ